MQKFQIASGHDRTSKSNLILSKPTMPCLFVNFLSSYKNKGIESTRIKGKTAPFVPTDLLLDFGELLALAARGEACAKEVERGDLQKSKKSFLRNLK